MSIKDKNKAMLREEANKLIARLEKIPDAETHFLAGLETLSIAQLIAELREFKPMGQNFINAYVRPKGTFREKVFDPYIAFLEAKYGLPNPPGTHLRMRII